MVCATGNMEQLDQYSDELGIRCPQCGCRHCPENKHEVAKTITLGQRKSIRRHRVCRNCGRKFITSETVLR